jgi:hypothetical protein
MMRGLTDQEREDIETPIFGTDDQCIAYAIDQAVARATTWQSMETYFKTFIRDGALFYVEHDDGGYDILQGYSDEEDNIWSSLNSERIKPTHWMPFPNPPLTKGDDNG